VVIKHLLVLDHSGYENYQTDVYPYSKVKKVSKDIPVTGHGGS
jgi:hypothetical protein